MVLCVCGTLGQPVAAVLVRVCACKRLRENRVVESCSIPPSFVSAGGLVEEMHSCIMSVAPYRLCVCLQRLRLCARWCGRVAGLCAKAWVRVWMFGGAHMSVYRLLCVSHPFFVSLLSVSGYT